MRLIPWVSFVLAVIATLNPIGLDFIRSAFLSGEQLSRNIAQPFVFGALAFFVLLAVLEILVRYWRLR